MYNNQISLFITKLNYKPEYFYQRIVFLPHENVYAGISGGYLCVTMGTFCIFISDPYPNSNYFMAVYKSFRQASSYSSSFFLFLGSTVYMGQSFMVFTNLRQEEI